MDDTGSYHRLSAELFRAPRKALTPEETAFLKVPNNASARASLEFITSKPHVAGTAGDLEMAEYVKTTFEKVGIAAVLDPQKVLLTYPVSSSLELLDVSGKMVAKASLAEDTLDSDPTTHTWWRNHTFNGYSPSERSLPQSSMRIMVCQKTLQHWKKPVLRSRAVLFSCAMENAFEASKP